jgi:hypothetical protein
MKMFLKVALCTAAAGAALAGWRLLRPSSQPQPPPAKTSGANGDFQAKGHGTAGELTPGQREQLLEELEDQLGV